MFTRLTAPLAAALLMTTPLLAQQAEAPKPTPNSVVIPVEATKTTPTNLQTEPTAKPAAGKSGCAMRAKHVMS